VLRAFRRGQARTAGRERSNPDPSTKVATTVGFEKAARARNGG
jgi:hypothetical protein